jgi:hypothetical protein
VSSEHRQRERDLFELFSPGSQRSVHHAGPPGSGEWTSPTQEWIIRHARRFGVIEVGCADSQGSEAGTWGRNLTTSTIQEDAVTPSEHNRPTDRTREAERDDAKTTSHADREPTEEEAKLAERTPLDPKVSEHEKEMAERGANQKGEGRLP